MVCQQIWHPDSHRVDKAAGLFVFHILKRVCKTAIACDWFISHAITKWCFSFLLKDGSEWENHQEIVDIRTVPAIHIKRKSSSSRWTFPRMRLLISRESETPSLRGSDRPHAVINFRMWHVLLNCKICLRSKSVLRQLVELDRMSRYSNLAWP